MQIISVAFA